MEWIAYKRDPRNKLTPPQEKLLLTYASTAGGNYEKYVEFCQRHLLPTFTKYYWPRWMQKRRAKIIALRTQITKAVAEEAMLGKAQRLLLLESHVASIERQLQKEGPDGENTLTPEQHVRYLDQQRKHMEAIARERGEWGANQDEPADRGGLDPDLLKQVSSGLLAAANKKREENIANTVDAVGITELP